MLDGGVPPLVAQLRVLDDRGFVARVDFALPELRLAIEYDGLWHAERAAFMSDRRRLDRLSAAGWTVLHVTADDMRHPARLLVRIRRRSPGSEARPRQAERPYRARMRALEVSRARRGPQSPKSWVHQGPAGPSATPTPSVRRPQSRMLARWPGLSIQPVITAAGSGFP